MHEILSISNFIYILGIILCLVTSILLWRFSVKAYQHNRYLAIYFLIISYCQLIVFLLYSRMMAEWPWYHIYRTGNIAALLFMPLSYLYFRAVLFQKKLKWSDLLHLIPVLIFMIDYLPVYFLPASEKARLALADVMSPYRGQKIQNGWFSPQVNWVFVRTAQFVIYWLLQLSMLLSLRKFKTSEKVFQENKMLIRWLKIICAAQLFYFLPNIINAAFGSDRYNFGMIHTSFSLSSCLLVIILFFFPEILYGLKGILVRLQDQTPETDSRPVSYQVKNEEPLNAMETTASTVVSKTAPRDEYLPQEKLEMIRKSIINTFENEKAFLNKGYSIQDLSVATGYPSYLLSSVINQVFRVRFNDLVNKYRVQYACSLIESGSSTLLTLQALSEDCGFSNRNSFTIAFKKATGQTPSAYAKRIIATPA